MSELLITKTYEDGDILYEADLDTIRTSVETKVNTTKLDTDNIANQGIELAKIIDATVTNGVIANGTFTAADIPDAAITTTELQDLGIDSATTNAVADGAITAGKIAATTVVNDNFDDGAIGTSNIADGAITPAKRNNNTQVSTGYNNTSISSAGDLVSKSITTTGRPVMILFDASASGGTDGTLGTTTAAGSSTSVDFFITRDSTRICTATVSVFQLASYFTTIGMDIPSSTLFHIDNVAAGTYTYYVGISGASTSFRGKVIDSRMELIEL